MSEDYAAIAQEAADAIASVGFTVTLEKQGAQTGPDYDPVIGPPTEHTLTVFSAPWKVRDENGNLTGKTMRVLKMAAGAVVPEKGEWLMVQGNRVRIGEVVTLAPGGVAVMYTLVLEG